MAAREWQPERRPNAARPGQLTQEHQLSVNTLELLISGRGLMESRSRFELDAGAAQGVALLASLP
jgi:hypothetical protein